MNLARATMTRVLGSVIAIALSGTAALAADISQPAYKASPAPMLAPEWDGMAASLGRDLEALLPTIQ
jgi:hypothetical protein